MFRLTACCMMFRITLAGCSFVFASANIIDFDTIPINPSGQWLGKSSLQVQYSCIDPSTPAGMEACLSVYLAPMDIRDASVRLTYEFPSITDAAGTKTTLVRKDGTTVKAKVGERYPQISTEDESYDGVEGADFSGLLIATDFALPSNTTTTALQMMLSQLIVDNGFKARAIPIFNYDNDGVVDDDGCLGPVDTTKSAGANSLEEKCPETFNFTAGMYKYTFFAYQVMEGCDGCTFTLRNKISGLNLTDLTLNDDKTLDTIGTDQVAKVRFADPDNSTVRYVEITFPTNTNSGYKDQQLANATGAVISATKISDPSFYLDIAVSAPGSGKWVSYDPTVLAEGFSTPSSASAGNSDQLSFGFFSLFLIVMAAFHGSC